MDADQLISFIASRRWLAAAIIIIGYLTRLLSDESRFPVSVPARFRPLVVALLGQGLSVLMMINGGTSWKTAVLTGAVVSFVTMGLFDLVVKAVFNGTPPWWIDILALVFPKAGPKGPPPPSGPSVLGGMMLVAALCLSGCSLFARELRALTAADAQCLQAHTDMADEKALELCAIETAASEVAKQILSDERRKTSRLAAEVAMRAELDAVQKLRASADGGCQ